MSLNLRNSTDQIFNSRESRERPEPAVTPSTESDDGCGNERQLLTADAAIDSGGIVGGQRISGYLVGNEKFQNHWNGTRKSSPDSQH